MKLNTLDLIEDAESKLQETWRLHCGSCGQHSNKSQQQMGEHHPEGNVENDFQTSTNPSRVILLLLLPLLLLLLFLLLLYY